jgi:hypothetical protein
MSGVRFEAEQNFHAKKIIQEAIFPIFVLDVTCFTCVGTAAKYHNRGSSMFSTAPQGKFCHITL